MRPSIRPERVRGKARSAQKLNNMETRGARYLFVCILSFYGPSEMHTSLFFHNLLMFTFVLRSPL